MKEVPAKVGEALRRDLEQDKFNGHYDYRSVIGMMNYFSRLWL